MTVKELIEQLSKFPPETLVKIDTDCRPMDVQMITSTTFGCKNEPPYVAIG